MRFLLKSAFWLGLIAFFLPFGQEARDDGTEISLYGAVLGARQALEDLSGFCSRAPQACDSGREIALFAGERIGDGVTLAYSFVDRQRDVPAAGAAAVAFKASDPQAVLAAASDPILTGTILDSPALPAAGIPPMPRAYRAPVRESSDMMQSPLSQTRSPRVPMIPIPTPAPRA